VWRAAVALTAVLALTAGSARAQQSDAQVAQNMENPVYSQVSMPLQNNFDCCYGPQNDGPRYTLNVEPVIPIGLGLGGDRWAVISRTIVPIRYEEDNKAGEGDHGGFGDIQESFFWAPKIPHDLAFGVGPTFIFPTGDSFIGTGKWQAGPTFAVTWKPGRWSAVLLFYQVWSFAGQASRSDVNRTRLQPSLSYTFPDSTQWKVGSETDYDWIKRQWTNPINFGISRVIKLSPTRRLSLALAGKVYADRGESPSAGLRFTATYVLPR
jgi:hypothetical protein